MNGCTACKPCLCMLRVDNAAFTSTRRQALKLPPSRASCAPRALLFLIGNAPLSTVSCAVLWHSRCLLETGTAEIEHDYKKAAHVLSLLHQEKWRKEALSQKNCAGPLGAATPSNIAAVGATRRDIAVSRVRRRTGRSTSSTQRARRKRRFRDQFRNRKPWHLRKGPPGRRRPLPPADENRAGPMAAPRDTGGAALGARWRVIALNRVRRRTGRSTSTTECAKTPMTSVGFLCTNLVSFQVLLDWAFQTLRLCCIRSRARSRAWRVLPPLSFSIPLIPLWRFGGLQFKSGTVCGGTATLARWVAVRPGCQGCNKQGRLVLKQKTLRKRSCRLG
jgi:hypothetical protein